MKIALAMIVKGTDEEAEFLARSLEANARYFDGVFITITHKKNERPNSKVLMVASKYKAVVSHFMWVDNFAAARNYNFSQVPKEYNFICWCDADDVFYNLKMRGLAGYVSRLKSILEEHPEVDAWTMQYYYDKDSHNNPTVVHTKTQVIRNDGSLEWVGLIHEDLQEKRSLNVRYIDDIKRIHVTTENHVVEAKQRNIRISRKDVDIRPNDPQAYFNLANSYLGVGDYKKARGVYLKFLKMSNSDAEKYIVYQRLSLVEKMHGNNNKAIDYLKYSIGMFPEFPDSFNQLGYLLFDLNQLDDAERYLLIGLVTKPQYQRMIVYNPRDYDYNPMMALAKIYFKKSRPDLALPMLKGCLTIYPDDVKLQGLVDEMEKETKRLEKVVEAAAHIDTLNGNKEKILYTINKLPVDLQSHPAICRIRNQYDVKTTSTGKEIVYYCGETVFEWNPELFKIKGFGGSEEAVVNLSKSWVEEGYQVTVYNSCGVQPLIADGVMYKPWWMFNAEDKVDHLIIWRHPAIVDHELNATNIYIDLHDVISENEFTEKRLKKIKKIFVKTQAHRALFPNIPDEKFSVIPNGIDLNLFNQDVERNPYLLVNTSSPDRSMDVLPALFKEVKKRIPQARLKWAYGWNNFDSWFANDKRMMEWKAKTVKEMEEAGIEDCGRLSQKECAKLYIEGRIFAYPSDFYEIDCISVKKAQAGGAKPITTNFAAMNESNQYGIKIHSDRTIKNWSQPYQVGFGTKDESTQKAWILAVIQELEKPMEENEKMKKWGEKFNWTLIAKQWINILN